MATTLWAACSGGDNWGQFFNHSVNCQSWRRKMEVELLDSDRNLCREKNQGKGATHEGWPLVWWRIAWFWHERKRVQLSQSRCRGGRTKMESMGRTSENDWWNSQRVRYKKKVPGGTKSNWVSGMFRMFRKCLEIKNSRSRPLTFVLFLFHSLLKALESIAIIDLSVIRLLKPLLNWKEMLVTDGRKYTEMNR